MNSDGFGREKPGDRLLGHGARTARFLRAKVQSSEKKGINKNTNHGPRESETLPGAEFVRKSRRRKSRKSEFGSDVILPPWYRSR